ncbi:outer membrane protein [Mesorhizobium sp. J428]|uniref:outer membrane protein n=1 Tax=Mesorhizobium sp. J428 TaxID=2898440 RepID=UPI002151FBB6|nr:outer membrane beta-barrel protein [Mesorhizobium sp. J428]MCR5858182.1 outer membrane beta-barrel protein [Mesorhizobium sp. J428]
MAACFAAAAADPTGDLESPSVDRFGGAAVRSWRGFYAGINAGYGAASSDEVDAQAFPDMAPILLGSLSPEGFSGGLQAGHNWQTGHLVFGVEADIQVSDLRDETTAAAFDQTLGTSSTSLDWYGTVRARVGYAAGRNLFYATGGFAYGGLDGTIDLAGQDGFTATLVTPDKIATGYAVGAGYERAVTETISLRGEYQFVHLAQTANGSVIDPSGTDTGVVGSSNVELNAHTVRIGLNLHF